MANYLSEKTYSQYFSPFENLSLSQIVLKTNAMKEHL